MLARMLKSPLSRSRIADFTRILTRPGPSLIRSDFRAQVWRIIRPGTMGNWIRQKINETHASREILKTDIMKRLQLTNEDLSKQNEGLLYWSDTEDQDFFENRAIGGCSGLFNPPMPAYYRNERPKRWSHDDEEPEDREGYGPGGYHPVRIGDVFHRRYHVVRKLGWGSSSTVWLCWDSEEHRFVALKVVKSAERYAAAAMEEAQMLLACNEKKDGEHPKRVVQLFDKFTIKGPNGIHVCLVLEAFGGDVLQLIISNKFNAFIEWQAREIIRQLLESLCHLHENNIVHTDIAPNNLLFTKAPNEIRQKAEEALSRTKNRLTKAKDSSLDCPDISPGGGMLFQLQDLTAAIGAASEEDYWQCANKGWEMKIGDLGGACWTHDRRIQNDQNRQYRSLELVIGAEFGPPTDIWSTACVAFELVTGDYLFTPNFDIDLQNNSKQLARIIEILGPVPPHILEKGADWRNAFSESGIRSPEPDPENYKDPERLFYYIMNNFNRDEDEMEEFADFLASMLKYEPSERATAAQCLKHPWMRPRSKEPLIAIVRPKHLENGDCAACDDDDNDMP